MSRLLLFTGRHAYVFTAPLLCHYVLVSLQTHSFPVDEGWSPDLSYCLLWGSSRREGLACRTPLVVPIDVVWCEVAAKFLARVNRRWEVLHCSTNRSWLFRSIAQWSLISRLGLSYNVSGHIQSDLRLNDVNSLLRCWDIRLTQLRRNLLGER